MTRVLALLIGICSLAGCSSAPVQEMSDARQAIAAAQVAGASERAPADFAAAQAAIARAEEHLQAQQYGSARYAALEAKRRAAAALAIAERSAAADTPPPH